MMFAESSLSAVFWPAAAAALGFVGKQVWELAVKAGETRRGQRASLLKLQSHLAAAKTSFLIQNGHALRLLERIAERTPGADAGQGYEELFARNFAGMTEGEKALHALIRGITIYSLRPVNEAMLQWLDSDEYFRGRVGEQGALGTLAQELMKLQQHLLLWRAKYEIWIPEHPEHALVYLDDEQRHGMGFPPGVDEAVRQVVGAWR